MHLILSEREPLKVWLKYIGPRTVHQKSWIFLFHVVAFCSESEYITLFEMPSILRELEPLKIHRTENGPSEKLDFSMACCSILFTDSDYIVLFETPSILSELEPIKVMKMTGQMVEHDVILHVANQKLNFSV